MSPICVRAAVAAWALGLVACGSPSPRGSASPRPEQATRTAADFIAAATRPWPTADARTRLVLTTPSESRVSIYDNALVALLWMQWGRHDDAGSILEALAALVRPDGSLPFSFRLESASTAPPYVRSGAVAWVGFAAATYLNVDRGGPAREAIVRMAHELAGYLLAHQVDSPDDPRAGLITGGEGLLAYEVTGNGVTERFEKEHITWTSVEHNVDAFFFLRALARVTESPRYDAAAKRIADALTTHAWDAGAGQFRRGIPVHGTDDVLALDGASWGALFLAAIGDRARAAIAAATADRSYESTSVRTRVPGHRPYAYGPLVDDESVAAYYGIQNATWERTQGVWPEGSAGVALAMARLGHAQRAREILDRLEPLRDDSGGLPTCTIEVPFQFDTKPSVAGTAWVALVRDELQHPDRGILWRI